MKPKSFLPAILCLTGMGIISSVSAQEAAPLQPGAESTRVVSTSQYDPQKACLYNGQLYGEGSIVSISNDKAMVCKSVWDGSVYKLKWE